MSSLGRRLLMCVGLAAVGLVLAVGPAGAKGLPIESVSVSSARPQTAQPVDVVARFGRGFNLGDEFAWASHEIAVFPVTRTDRNGWPVDRDDPGLPVQLHPVGNGVYRGSFTVADAGQYVVVSWSAFYAHEDPLSGVTETRDYPVPLTIRVAAAATAAPSSSGISMVTIGVIAACVGMILAIVALWSRGRRRSRHRHEELAAEPVEDRVLVGDGPYRP